MQKFYKIGEFAELVGVSVSTLRNWERNGVLVAMRTPTGQRRYTHEQYDSYIDTNPSWQEYLQSRQEFLAVKEA